MDISGVVKFGPIGGKSDLVFTYPAAASQAFKNLGGFFVKLDSNERIDLADSGDTEIIGWAYYSELTTSATAGNTSVPVDIGLDRCYLLPTDAVQTETQLRGLVGHTCDLIVSAGGLQQADIGESNEDVLQIVDYMIWGTAATQQGVIVRLNPIKIGASGVV